jgi:hypothetical protein
MEKDGRWLLSGVLSGMDPVRYNGFALYSETV